jgi:hypothetical protein
MVSEYKLLEFTTLADKGEKRPGLRSYMPWQKAEPSELLPGNNVEYRGTGAVHQQPAADKERICVIRIISRRTGRNTKLAVW